MVDSTPKNRVILYAECKCSLEIGLGTYGGMTFKTCAAHTDTFEDDNPWYDAKDEIIHEAEVLENFLTCVGKTCVVDIKALPKASSETSPKASPENSSAAKSDAKCAKEKSGAKRVKKNIKFEIVPMEF